MVFIAVIILFVWLGIRKGLLYMATVLFNLLIALYIGIVSTPQVLRLSAGFHHSAYFAVGCLTLIAGAVYYGLFRLACRLFLQDGGRYFGILLDKAGSSVTGFLTGYILWGFLMLVFSMLPLGREPIIQQYVTGENAREFARITMTDVCQAVVTASLDSPQTPVAQRVRTLLELQDANTPPESIP